MCLCIIYGKRKATNENWFKVYRKNVAKECSGWNEHFKRIFDWMFKREEYWENRMTWVKRLTKKPRTLEPTKCKRYQPQNAVYLLCVNWSHSEVIKKRNRLTGTTIHVSHQSMNSEGKRRFNTMKNICIQTSNTCNGLSVSVAVYVTSQLINSPTEHTRQATP